MENNANANALCNRVFILDKNNCPINDYYITVVVLLMLLLLSLILLVLLLVVVVVVVVVVVSVVVVVVVVVVVAVAVAGSWQLPLLDTCFSTTVSGSWRT